MTNPNEQRMYALEQLQQAGEPLAAYDFGTLAALRRSGDEGLAARADVVTRIETTRARKRRAARKAAPARRERSVFDRTGDDEATVLP